MVLPLQEVVFLKNVRVSGEVALAIHVAAEASPPENKRLIMEEYIPELVFNAGDTALSWQRMPATTNITQKEARTSGCKAAKDRVTLLICGSTADHMIKPGLVYKAGNPRALRNRNNNLLPVYWMHDKKAWITKKLLSDWLQQSLLPRRGGICTTLD